MKNTIQKNNRLKKVAALIFMGAVISCVFSGTAFADKLLQLKLNTPDIVHDNFAIKQNNLDEMPALNGGEVRFLKNNATDGQQLSVVMKSSDGKVIVIDGGWTDDSEHLLNTIKSFGGKVDAWLITHPQADHVGAITDIINNHRSEITVDGFYYNFFDKMWYRKVDEDEIGSVSFLMKALDTLPDALKHSNMQRGDVVELSPCLSFRVMNSPVKTRDRYAVNSSGLMYDITLDSKHFIILGDMGAQVGDVLASWGVLDNVVCDYVQMSHHGQDGVSEEFYKRLAPKNCIWPTTEWLFYSSETSGYFTYMTKVWVQKLKVYNNYATLTEDVVIR